MKNIKDFDEIEKIFRTYHLYSGRMIGGSKSGYHSTHPNDDILFNANIFIPSLGKVWWGDLNITLDNEALQEVCNKIGEEMIIVSEMLGRFEAEERLYKEIENNAHIKFIPNSDEYQKREYDGYKGVTIDKMTIVVKRGINWIKKKIST